MAISRTANCGEFHDGRHTALTRLAKKGVPDWVIRAQFGHVSPAMMAIYSHVRRRALDEAAQALEPDATEALSPTPEVPTEVPVHDRRVTSHVTSQPTSARGNVVGMRRPSRPSGTPRTARSSRGATWRARPADCVARGRAAASVARASDSNRQLSNSDEKHRCTAPRMWTPSEGPPESRSLPRADALAPQAARGEWPRHESEASTALAVTELRTIRQRPVVPGRRV